LKLQPAGRNALDSEPRCLHGLRVLAVDDNTTNRLILLEMLARWSMAPTLAENPSEALESMSQAAAAGAPFAVVLSDVMMPGMDGFQFAERITRQPDLAGTPVILLSSADRQPDSLRCRQAGVSAYLSKPVKQSELLDAIVTALNPSREDPGPAVPGRDRRQPPSASCRSRPLHVLLVEDNATNQVLALTLLEKAGHTVETAASGKEALAALAARSFDLVLMDIQMPDMDGFEATARIREREQATGNHIPIVAMTAHAMKGDRERCLQAGMDAYVSKPIQASVLYDTLASVVPSDSPALREERALAQQSLEGARSTNAVELGADSAPRTLPPDVLDKAALLARVGGRADRLRRIVGVFLEESTGLMAKLNDAIATGQASGLKRPAHSLKGAVGIFGVQTVFDAAAAVEALGEAGELAGASDACLRLEREMESLRSALAALVSSPEEVGPASGAE
jgi:CheY-like chemotaxis protein